MMHHFIRGYFDGDGSIWKYRRESKKSDDAGFSIIGSKMFITGLYNYMMSKNIVLHIYPCKSNAELLVLHSTKRKTIKDVYEYMYEGSRFFLSRKKELFETIILNTDFTQPRFSPTSKIKGISYIKNKKRWIVRVNINRKRKQIGSFLTETQAINCLENWKNIHTS